MKNGLARVVTHLATRLPITPTLNELYWFPHKTLDWLQNHHFNLQSSGVWWTGLPILHNIRALHRELRSSADTRNLNTERTKTVIAVLIFCSSSTIWNILPLVVRDASSTATLKNAVRRGYILVLALFCCGIDRIIHRSQSCLVIAIGDAFIVLKRKPTLWVYTPLPGPPGWRPRLQGPPLATVVIAGQVVEADGKFTYLGSDMDSFS